MIKNEVKHTEKVTVLTQEELQIINNSSNKKNKQPLPQPKDYDEIEY